MLQWSAPKSLSSNAAPAARKIKSELEPPMSKMLKTILTAAIAATTISVSSAPALASPFAVNDAVYSVDTVDAELIDVKFKKKKFFHKGYKSKSFGKFGKVKKGKVIIGSKGKHFYAPKSKLKFKHKFFY